MSLVLVAGSCAALFPVLGTIHKAWADGDDDDSGDDDSANGDDDSGDDSGDQGDDEDDQEDEDQPPITAGGLYTLQTYPQGEIQRPLTMTMGITQLRAGVGFDISNKTAFDTFGGSLDARYGVQDHVEVDAGFKGISNFKTISAYAAFEGALVYDLIDFRAGLQLDHTSGDTEFGVTVGFPFRYAVKPQLAITALETAFQVQFDSKPDATPSIGVVIQPAPIFAVKVSAAVRVKDFDFSNAASLSIPATADLQLSPNNKLDVGLDFTFNNLKPADSSVKFYDDRFLLFFGQIRL
ncbi:MAG TPA: hypothetical protein VHE35_11030 [Kofleriaceae bacterium]|nr:hypothetical protein [Kofleriaceae bacterium]